MEIDSENVAQPVKVGAAGRGATQCAGGMGGLSPCTQRPIQHPPRSTAAPPMLPLCRPFMLQAPKAAKAKAAKPAAGGHGKTIEETYQKLSQVRQACVCCVQRLQAGGH